MSLYRHFIYSIILLFFLTRLGVLSLRLVVTFPSFPSFPSDASRLCPLGDAFPSKRIRSKSNQSASQYFLITKVVAFSPDCTSYTSVHNIGTGLSSSSPPFLPSYGIIDFHYQPQLPLFSTARLSGKDRITTTSLNFSFVSLSCFWTKTTLKITQNTPGLLSLPLYFVSTQSSTKITTVWREP